MRRGRQLTPAEFTKDIESVHAQAAYLKVEMQGFTVNGDMCAKMEKEINGRKQNRAVGCEGCMCKCYKWTRRGEPNCL